MLSLLYHRYRVRPAFVCAYPAALAIIEICLEKAILALLYATFRTIDITDAALDAFRVIPDRSLRPPTACMIFTGAARLGYNTSYGKLFPCFQCHNGYTP